MLRIGGVITLMTVSPLVFGSYSVRLAFENLTRGTSNAGALEAQVGDELAIRYTFHGVDSPNRWGIFQMTLLDSPVLSAGDASTWETQLQANVTPASAFTARIRWQLRSVRFRPGS